MQIGEGGFAEFGDAPPAPTGKMEERGSDVGRPARGGDATAGCGEDEDVRAAAVGFRVDRRSDNGEDVGIVINALLDQSIGRSPKLASSAALEEDDGASK
ncbi:hypothetical protein ACLOJK_024110 [Asimina triloba]